MFHARIRQFQDRRIIRASSSGAEDWWDAEVPELNRPVDAEALEEHAQDDEPLAVSAADAMT
jgi:hypothetical protein